MPVFGRRVVGDDEELKGLGRAGVENLVRLAGRVQDDIADGKRVAVSIGADGGRAGGDPEEFPLGGVRVEGAHVLGRREAIEFHLEGMRMHGDEIPKALR